MNSPLVSDDNGNEGGDEDDSESDEDSDDSDGKHLVDVSVHWGRPELQDPSLMKASNIQNESIKHPSWKFEFEF